MAEGREGTWICERCRRVLVGDGPDARELGGHVSVRAWWRRERVVGDGAYRADAEGRRTATIEIDRALEPRLGGGHESFVVLAAVLAILWSVAIGASVLGLCQAELHGDREAGILLAALAAITGGWAFHAHLGRPVARSRLVVGPRTIERLDGPASMIRSLVVAREDGDRVRAREGATVVELDREGERPIVLVDRLTSPASARDVARAVDDALGGTRAT